MSGKVSMTVVEYLMKIAQSGVEVNFVRIANKNIRIWLRNGDIRYVADVDMEKDEYKKDPELYMKHFINQLLQKLTGGLAFPNWSDPNYAEALKEHSCEIIEIIKEAE